MFLEVPESEIFRNQLGHLVLNDANKFKEVDGKMVHHLRFISNLTPANTYMPQASPLSMMLLRPDECAWMVGEDLQSCYNCFTFRHVGECFSSLPNRCPARLWAGRLMKLLM